MGESLNSPITVFQLVDNSNDLHELNEFFVADCWTIHNLLNGPTVSELREQGRARAHVLHCDPEFDLRDIAIRCGLHDPPNSAQSVQPSLTYSKITFSDTPHAARATRHADLSRETKHVKHSTH